MKRFTLLIGLFFLLVSSGFSESNVCDFEIFDLEDNNHLETALQTNFTCNDVTFSYKGTNGDYSFYWNGFAYSTHRDTYTNGYENQYSAITKYGYDKSDTYVVAYPDSTDFISMDEETNLTGFYITNTTYAYFTIKEGNQFSKIFGGETGNDEDYFKLTITGYDKNDDKTGDVDFYLADYRFSDNSKDYIVNQWKWVDLSSLGKVKKLKFALSSTDNGSFGMNTPGYFAMDNFNGEDPDDDDDVVTCFIDSASDSNSMSVFTIMLMLFSIFITLSLKREKNDK